MLARSRMLLLLCGLLSGCAGGSSGGTHLGSALPNVATAPAAAEIAPSQSAPAQAVPVQLSYKLPTAVQTQSVARVTQLYIAPGNTTITVTVTPLGGAPVTTGPTACTAASCSVNFSATPGPNTILFTLQDGSAHTLSTFSTVAIVQAAMMNVLSYSSNPVVNSVTLSLGSAMPNAGTAYSDPLTVAAQDADGNTIVGNTNYVDANGNPLSLLLSVANTQAGGKGTVTIQGPLRIASPLQTAIYARYDGNWLDHANITVATTSSVSGALSGTMLTPTPTATLYNNGITAGANPHGITTGPDGNIWFTEFSGNRVGKMSTSGKAVEYSMGVLASSPIKIEPGPDGFLYMNYYYSAVVQRVALSGAVTTVATLAHPTSFGITTGPGGRIWIPEAGNGGTYQSTIASLPEAGTSGALIEYTAGITASAGTNSSTLGPDGNIWFTEQNANKIGRITAAGVVTEYSTGITASAQPFGIVGGPDGNLWFTEYSGNRIGRLVPSTGISTEFSTGITASAGPRSIINGPDGNIWFSEDPEGRIGRITTTGAITEFSSGFNAGSRAMDLTLGSDGNIWFTDLNDSEVGKFVL